MFTGAVIITFIVTCWGYIKSFFTQLSGILIVNTEIDMPFGYAIVPFAQKTLTESKFTQKSYWSTLSPIRSLNKIQLVAAEIQGDKGSLFWFKHVPIWIKANFDKDIWKHSSSIVYIRGTFNGEKFLSDCLDFFNKEMLEYKKDRFRIVNVFGTDGKPAQLDNKTNDIKESEKITYNVLKSSKLLKTDNSDLGIENNREINYLERLSLNDSTKNFINELDQWFSNKDWFAKRGLPWKIGATLHGKPGTGKSVLISSIARQYNMPVFIYNLASLYDNELFARWKEMLAQTPCIAVFEDFDAVFDKRKNITGGHLTLDAILNVLDGIDRPNGLVTFLTTNHIENIDDAIIRAGRIDRIIQMTNLDYNGRLKMATRILEGYESIIEKLVNDNSEVSGAEFQLICERKALELYHSNQEIDQLLEEANI